MALRLLRGRFSVVVHSPAGLGLRASFLFGQASLLRAPSWLGGSARFRDDQDSSDHFAEFLKGVFDVSWAIAKSLTDNLQFPLARELGAVSAKEAFPDGRRKSSGRGGGPGHDDFGADFVDVLTAGSRTSGVSERKFASGNRESAINVNHSDIVAIGMQEMPSWDAAL